MGIQHRLGRKGEELALAHLQTLGYQILDRNWHFHHLELDIVAKDGDELVIVEVKTRGSNTYEHPAEAVSDKKIRFLVNATEAYIIEKDLDVETRFDVIAITFFGENYNLEHYKDAFYPPLG